MIKVVKNDPHHRIRFLLYRGTEVKIHVTLFPKMSAYLCSLANSFSSRSEWQPWRKTERIFLTLQQHDQIATCVADPWHVVFGTHPDPGIRTSDQRIQIRIRILLFSSLTFKVATKNYNSFLSFLLVIFWSYKKKSQNSRNQGFPYYFGLMMKDPGGPKTFRSYRSYPDSASEHWLGDQRLLAGPIPWRGSK
jgi:hypothetical protein